MANLRVVPSTGALSESSGSPPETSRDIARPSPLTGTERKRRTRERRKAGIYRVTVEAPEGVLLDALALGLLDSLNPLDTGKFMLEAAGLVVTAAQLKRRRELEAAEAAQRAARGRRP